MWSAFGGVYPPITQNKKKTTQNPKQIYPGFVLWKDWQKSESGKTLGWHMVAWV